MNIATTIKRALCLLLVLLLSSCSGLLFYPDKTMYQTPEILDLKYEDVYLPLSRDIKLHGWWLPSVGPAKGTVYFLHGNAQNISTHMMNVAWMAEAGYQVFMIDYRGYGRSTGIPVIPDVFDDIRSGFLYLLTREEVKQKPIFVFAQSLGASMSGYVFATDPQLKQAVTAIMLDSAFTGYDEIGKDVASRTWLTWLFQYPVAWSMPSEYNLDNVIDEMSPTPLLILHSKEDQVIPFAHGQALYEKAQLPKAFFEYHGDHIAVFFNHNNRKTVLKYMQDQIDAQQNATTRNQ
ncbi:alpha/beta hydrolase [Thalassotalea agarivorans]|uniref:alpha/beta hydrolase n=1 Tax=Thalassotalea agarivorans TaxID=349064 RepID=UPI0015A54FB7|nr:alpha/beta fold hydrolase [Thalassotalea agarivorans]